MTNSDTNSLRTAWISRWDLLQSLHCKPDNKQKVATCLTMVDNVPDKQVSLFLYKNCLEHCSNSLADSLCSYWQYTQSDWGIKLIDLNHLNDSIWITTFFRTLIKLFDCHLRVQHATFYRSGNLPDCTASELFWNLSSRCSHCSRNENAWYYWNMFWSNRAMKSSLKRLAKCI